MKYITITGKKKNITYVNDPNITLVNMSERTEFEDIKTTIPIENIEITNINNQNGYQIGIWHPSRNSQTSINNPQILYTSKTEYERIEKILENYTNKPQIHIKITGTNIGTEEDEKYSTFQSYPTEQIITINKIRLGIQELKPHPCYYARISRNQQADITIILTKKEHERIEKLLLNNEINKKEEEEMETLQINSAFKGISLL